MNILLSPLGLSPGAVSGIYHALEDEGTHIDRVVTISSSTHLDAKTNLAVRYLSEYLKSQGVPYENRAIASSDLIQEPDVLAFMQQVEDVLQDAQSKGDKVYLGIAGGRKSMAALATIAAQLHGTEALYHLWVDEDIDKWGMVDELRKLERSDTRWQNAFHPPRDKRRLVRIPFLSLAAYRDDFERLLRSIPGFVSPTVRELADRLGYVDHAGNVTPQGQEIARLIQTPMRGVGYLSDLGTDEQGRVFDENRLLEAIRASCPGPGRKSIETSTLEFKTGLEPRYFMFHLLHAICAFANGDNEGKNRGGIVVLGVPDSFEKLAGARRLREEIAANVAQQRDRLLRALQGEKVGHLRAQDHEVKDYKLQSDAQGSVPIVFEPRLDLTAEGVPVEHALRVYPAEWVGLEGGQILVVIVRPNLSGVYRLSGQDVRRRGTEKIRIGAYEDASDGDTK